MLRSFVVVAAFALVSLAGCMAGPEPQDPPLASGPDDSLIDPDNNTTLNETFGAHSVVEAPVWSVGTWWGHHIFERDGHPSGQHHNVAVVSTDGGYQTATKHETMALRDAQEDLPTLGLQSTTLETTNRGEAFYWYDWPLEVGKQWQQPFTVNNTTHALDFAVDYTDEIPTALGPRPGFSIVGSAEGVTVLSYDYVPELSWFAELTVFDPGAEDADTPEYRIMNMGYGTVYSDQWRTYTITPLVTWDYGYDVAASEAPDPEIETSFEITEGTAKVYGPASVRVDSGQVTLRLTTPSGDTYELEVDAPGGSDDKVFDIASPEAGMWTARVLGGGVLVDVALHLDALDETIGTVTPAPDAS